jgi:hypothetical protein
MIRYNLAATALVALALSATPAIADDCPVAQYVWSKEMGQIQLSTGYMERPSDLDARRAAWERNGLVVLESVAGHTFARKEIVPGHAIETTISIAPPAGHGEGGASSNADLRILVDGDTLVNCPLAYAYVGLNQISVDPARKYVTLVAHARLLYFDGFESRRVVDQDWLLARAEAMQKLNCPK